VSSGSGVAVPALRTAREEAHRTDKMDLLQINRYGLTLTTLDTDVEVSMPALESFRRGFLSSLQVVASDSKGSISAEMESGREVSKMTAAVVTRVYTRYIGKFARSW